MPEVSVVVPVFTVDVSQVRDFLACIERQTFSTDKVELLMIDNGVSVPVARFLKVALSTRPWLAVVNCDKPGAYAARNAALERARGTVIAFTDIDCAPAPDWIESGCEALKRGGLRHMVAGKIAQRFVIEERPTLIEAYDKLMSLRQDWYVSRGAAATANLFVPAPLTATIGPFDEAAFSGSDTRWVQKATSTGVELTYAENVRVDHPCRRTPTTHLVRARRGAGANYVRSAGQNCRFTRALRYELGFFRLRLALLKSRYRSETVYFPYVLYLGVTASTHAVRVAEVIRLSAGGAPERR